MFFSNPQNEIAAPPCLFQHLDRNRDLFEDFGKGGVGRRSGTARNMSGHQNLRSNWSLHEPNREPPDSSSMKAQQVDGKRRRPATQLVRPGAGGSSEGSTKLLQEDFYPMPPTEISALGRRIEAWPALSSLPSMLQPGDKAPNFDLPDQNGNPVKLSDLKGQMVVLYLSPR
ncbi:MAG: redoxin domain-containing protein [Solirubrobacterales bacterium]